MSIRFSRMMELVSQAEKEGITLAAMISRETSPDEMAQLQEDIGSLLNANYYNIEHFMAEVSVPSIEEVLSRRHDENKGHPSSPIEHLSDR